MSSTVDPPAVPIDLVKLLASFSLKDSFAFADGVFVLAVVLGLDVILAASS